MNRVIKTEIKSGHDGRFYYIYKITNMVNEKFYYGKHHTRTLDDNYSGSGKLLKLSYQKYGKENFLFEIISFHDDITSLNLEESKIVNVDLIKSKQCYNLKLGGDGGYCQCEECRRKVNLAISKSERIKENARRQAKASIGKKRPEKTGRLISLSLKGKPKSEESKIKMAAAKLGTKQEIVTCNVCGKSGGISMMRMYHFENCGKKFNRTVTQVECPHCHKIGNSNIMKRWHFDNCKENK